MKTYEVHLSPESWGPELETDSLKYARKFARKLSLSRDCYITKDQDTLIAKYSNGKKI